ncbi:hypothetical protein GYMC52_2376 [Geobacillus sp. Y412MC52]|nr:hypothetical protein GYMC52_2376 [Geobacillus sp. Y412MC52]
MRKTHISMGLSIRVHAAAREYLKQKEGCSPLTFVTNAGKGLNDANFMFNVCQVHPIFMIIQ